MPTGINLVPNNTGSAGVGSTLGTVSKKWDNIYSTTGSIDYITSSIGSLYVSGHITASGGIKADSFQSVTGGTGIEFSDDLNVIGDISASNIQIANVYADNIARPSDTADYIRIGSPIGIYQDAAVSFWVSPTLTVTKNKLMVGTLNDSGEQVTVKGSISASGDLSVEGNISMSQGGTQTIDFHDTDVKAGYIKYTHSSDIMYFNTSGSTRMSISGNSSNSFVGIGTSPFSSLTHTLTVSGDISASGDLYVGGNYITQSGQFHNFIGNISASGGISANYIHLDGGDTSYIDNCYIGQRTPAILLKTQGLSIYGNTILGNNTTFPTIDLRPHDTNQTVNVFGDLVATGDISASDGLYAKSASFSNLATSDVGISTGSLYTQLGSELGLGSITASIATKKFVLIK